MFEKTGYLRGRFENTYGNKRVLNFYLTSGYFDATKSKFVEEELPFETWHHDLIDRITQIPRGHLVTIRFDIVSRKSEIGGKKFTQAVLKANTVVHWNAKGGESVAVQTQMEIPNELFRSGSEGRRADHS